MEQDLWTLNPTRREDNCPYVMSQASLRLEHHFCFAAGSPYLDVKVEPERSSDGGPLPSMLIDVDCRAVRAGVSFVGLNCGKILPEPHWNISPLFHHH